MYIDNQSKYPDREVNDLIRYATKRLRKQLTPQAWKTLKIKVTGSASSYKGRAFWSSPYYIIIRIGEPKHFPLKDAGYGWKYKTAPKYSMENWQEAMVVVAAHEACHIKQFHKRTKRSEIEAEHYALKVLTRYRSKQ